MASIAGLKPMSRSLSASSSTSTCVHACVHVCMCAHVPWHLWCHGKRGRVKPQQQRQRKQRRAHATRSAHTRVAVQPGAAKDWLRACCACTRHTAAPAPPARACTPHSRPAKPGVESRWSCRRPGVAMSTSQRWLDSPERSRLMLVPPMTICARARVCGCGCVCARDAPVVAGVWDDAV
jgi:hypothetical protein